MRAGPLDDVQGQDLRRRAYESYQRAGERAERLGAPETAKVALEHAAELAPDRSTAAGLLERAAHLAHNALQRDEAARLARASAAAHEAAGAPRDARRMGAMASWVSAPVTDEVKAELRAALDVLAEGPRDRGYAEVAISLANIQLFSGEPIAVVAAQLEDGLDAAEACGDMGLISRGMGVKGVLMAWLGRPVESSALFVSAVETARETGDTTAMMQAFGNLTDNLLTSDAPNTMEKLREATALAQRLGNRNALQTMRSNLWLALLFAGGWDEVEAQTAEQLKDYDFGDVHARLTLLRAWRGDTAAAAEEIELTSAQFTDSDLQDREILSAAQAVVLVAQGDLEGAITVTAPVLDHDAGIRRESYRVALPVAVEAALELGRLDDAAEMLRKVVGRGPGDAPPFLRAQLARFRARIAWARGEGGKEVGADLRAAVAQLDDLGYPYYAARARLDLAAWLAESGEHEQARSLCRTVGTVAAELGARPLGDAADDLLARVSSTVTT